MSTIRVLVAAPQTITRAGLSALLEAEPSIAVAGAASDPETLLAQCEHLAPDVVLLDAADAARSWLADLSEQAGGATLLPPLLLLADDPDLAAGALRAGAAGLLLRDATPAEMVTALQAVAAGLIAIDRRAADALLAAVPAEAEPGDALPIEPLTPREREIVQLIARGLPNKAIATELGISEHTVKFHVGSILDKLGAASRAEALARAARAGLIVL